MSGNELQKTREEAFALKLILVFTAIAVLALAVGYIDGRQQIKSLTAELETCQQLTSPD